MDLILIAIRTLHPLLCKNVKSKFIGYLIAAHNTKKLARDLIDIQSVYTKHFLCSE